MLRRSIKEIQAGLAPLGQCHVQGWVRTHRQSKNISFIEVNDGSAVKGLQLVIEPGLPSYQAVASRISTGAAIRASGLLVESPGSAQRFELQAGEIELVGEACVDSYPLQKKGHTLDFLREIPHLRPRSNTFGAVFRLRSLASYAIHTFFQERGFYHLHSPIITTSDCEGAGAMFRVTTLDIANTPKHEGKVDFSKDFFNAEASLTVSGQLEGEIFATALSKVYTFGPTFRAENSNTTRHLAEFWMIEPEVAFADLKDNMTLASEMLSYLIRYLLQHGADDLEFLAAREWTEKGHLDALRKVAEASYETIEYTEAIGILERCGKKFEYPVSWGIDLQSEHERYLTDEHVKGPLFVINYPKDIKAFYMKLNDDGKTVRAMDMLVPRLGEIIGGSQREEREDVLREKMLQCHLSPESYWWYLELRKFGTVPHAGFGLGFERFLMYVTGMQNIRDVIPFARYPGFAAF